MNIAPALLRRNHRPLTRLTMLAAALGVLHACTGSSTVVAPAAPGASGPEATAVTDALKDKVKTIVVIYAENRSFDNLFGRFPGANGLGAVLDANGNPTGAYAAQKDRDGKTALATLPQTWSGVTMPGTTPVITQAQSAGLPNRPFAVETAFMPAANASVTVSTNTRDLWHRFYENQMQINGGANDGFAAWGDAGGLTMGYFDYRGSAIYKLAEQFVLADNFFQGAFGGSFLNHQYLVCACALEYPNADTAPAKPTITTLDKTADGKYTARLTPAGNLAASALDGPAVYARSGNLTPANYFGDGKYYAVNTMQPPYQPSGTPPVDLVGDHALYADLSKPATVPIQNPPNIGDQLSAAGVGWKWYAGGWNAAIEDGRKDPKARRTVIYWPNEKGVADSDHVDFQAHHQPFNYYSNLDPVSHADDRQAHLKDYRDLITDISGGTLPPVVFYKPEGSTNQHPGYANLQDGDTRIADVVARLQASPQWSQMVVVITYDEFGGAWDHVAPPKGDLLGPGTRIPAIIVSPLARKGMVDHTPYDTGSILRLISRRFDLQPLPGVVKRDAGLRAAGNPPMGDLTTALSLR